MLKIIIAWLQRRKLIALPAPKYHLEFESMLPTNIEAFYLATLDVIYSYSGGGQGIITQIHDAMIEKLGYGESNPYATLADNPVDFYLNAQHQQWCETVARNELWFEDARNQLLKIIWDFEAAHKLEDDTKKDSRDIKLAHRRTICEVASGFCGTITVKRMTNDVYAHLEIDVDKSQRHDCVIIIEFQERHWVFYALAGRVLEQKNQEINGKAINPSELSKIDYHCANMIHKIAQNVCNAWVRTARLYALNEQPLIKSSALQISRITNACYHEHLLEINELTQSDELNIKYIRRFYEIKYKIYYPRFKLIEPIYKNIYAEKELASWLFDQPTKDDLL